MTVRYFAWLLTLACIFGCKHETPIDELPLVRPELAATPVMVTLEAIVEEDDVFEVFYAVDSLGNFVPDKSMRVDVPGRAESQSIVFNLPDDAQIKNLRLDVGQNPEQGEVEIKKLLIRQHGKQVEVDGKQFLSCFNANENIKVDAGNNSFTIETVRNVYDPMFYGNDVFKEKVKALN